MNFGNLSKSLLGKSEFFLKKNGPTLLTGTGLVGFVGTTVLVGKAVLRAQTTMDSFHIRKETLNERDVTTSYTKEDHAKAVGQLYVGTAKELTRIFWPALVVGGVSIACIISSHGMMKRKEASLVAAYAALDAGFKTYRKRIAEELGADKELDIYRGVRSSKEDTTDAGQPCIINEYDKKVGSPYARFFDKASSPSWTKTPEYNMMFLKAQEQWANDQLRIRGHIFLNEVYDSLGLERSQAGQVVGWSTENVTGRKVDGYVDFGLFDGSSDEKKMFINGQNDSVMLDFNVDGPISI